MSQWGETRSGNRVLSTGTEVSYNYLPHYPSAPFAPPLPGTKPDRVLVTDAHTGGGRVTAAEVEELQSALLKEAHPV